MDPQEQIQQDQQIQQLQEQLKESIQAENFFELGSGKLFLKLASAEINKLVNEITSDKYVKDHAGYLAALADLKAYRKLLRKLQVSASPERRAKIEERLSGYDGAK